MRTSELSDQEFNKWYNRSTSKYQGCAVFQGKTGISSLRESYDREVVEYKPFTEEIVENKITQVRLFIKRKYRDIVLKDLSSVKEKSRLKFEIDTSLSVKHDNIVKFYRCLYEDITTERSILWSSYIFLAMEYCDLGPSMVIDKNFKPKSNRVVDTVTRRKLRFTRFKTYHKDEERHFYTVEEVRQILTPIVEALCYLHNHESRIAHLDLKPDNILLTRQGNGEVVPKLTDFGVSISKKFLQNKTGKCLSAPGGTVWFHSLERFKPFDPYKDDVWGIGITMYVYLTGFLLSENGFKVTKANYIGKRRVISKMKKREALKYPWLKTWCQIHPGKRATMETVLDDLKDNNFVLYQKPTRGSVRSFMSISTQPTASMREVSREGNE